MRIEQVRAFLTIVETGGFQQAAKKCKITQSTISRQIQALETELETSLLHRTSKVKLTVAGELFLPRARKIDREWQLAKSEITELLSGKQQELCVAVIPSICASYLPPVLDSFISKYPQVQLRVTCLGSERAIKVLRDGLVDAAIVMQSNLFKPTSEIVLDDLYSEAIVVLLSSRHPLANCKYITPEKLIEYPQIIFKEGYAMQTLVRDYFDRLGAKLNAVLELNSIDAFRGAIRHSNWLALLPQSAILDIKNDLDLTVRPLSQPVPIRQTILVTTQDRLEIPPIQYFRQLVLEFVKPKVDLIAI